MPLKFQAALLPLLAIVGLPLMPAAAPAQAPATASAAASAPPAARPDPVDAKAAVAAVRYRSSLSDYQAFAEPAVAPWRETNERVRERGGWRAYAREASETGGARDASDAAGAPAAAPSASESKRASGPATSGRDDRPVK
jgi:hypothetical protein